MKDVSTVCHGGSNIAIKFLLFNPRSINNKVGNLMGFLEDKDIDIAAICETWITNQNTPTTAVIKSYGYSIQHNFRANKRGGGTALIFKNCIKFSVVNYQRAFESFEVIMRRFISKSSKVIFVVMYRTGNVTSVFNRELDLLLSDVSMRADTFILAGDLNLHFDNCQGVVKQSLDVFLSYGMKKIVNEPTHINGSSLDQIFIHALDKKDIVRSLSIESENSLKSDHFPVMCTLDILADKKFFKSIQYRKLNDIDPIKFHDALSDIISSYEISPTFFQSITSLSESISNLMNHFAPYQSKSISVMDKAPWFDNEYRDLRKLRRNAERIKHRSDENFLRYKELCDKASMLATIKKKSYFDKLIEKSQNKPYTLFQMVNNVLDKNQFSSLPDYTDDISKLASDFNQYYIEKIDKIRESMPQNWKDHHEKDSSVTLLFEFEPTTQQEIDVIIKESGMNCSPDDILPQKLYEDNISCLLPVITDLVNLSLSSGSIDGAKLGNVIPLIKNQKLDANNLKNYRPVTNLTFLGKLIERVVLKRLESQLAKNNLNCSDQFAYKKHHSTETLLIKLTNDILIAADEKSATVVMLLDLSAAFDTVDHDVLLRILKNEIGVRGIALAWFTSFLKGRSQCIRLGKVTSETVTIRFGIPQGSVLGPVLFNLYIRSIYAAVKKLDFNILGYADDHQIYQSFKCGNQLPTLTMQLRQCFRGIKTWMSLYYLQLNDSKTEISVFGSRNVLNDIQLGGINMTPTTTIRFVSSVKNLGFIMDNQLTYQKQIVELKKKCSHTIRNLRKIRFLLNDEQCKLVVNSLVISCLDYGNALYYGITDKLLNQLQVIQNSAAKVVTKKFKYDHLGDDLIKLHWLTIKKRVIFKIALLAHKSLLGIAPSYLQEMFLYAHFGREPKLIAPPCYTSYGQRSFSYSAPRIYNKLPHFVKSSANITDFKKTLKTFLFDLSDVELSKLYKLSN